MPDPIRNAKMTEPASPLEYRSGREDFDELGPYWQLDGPLVRAGLIILGMLIGFLVEIVICLVLAFITQGSAGGFTMLFHCVALAIEILFVWKVGQLRPTRTTTLIDGVLFGMMAIPIVLIFLTAYAA